MKRFILTVILAVLLLAGAFASLGPAAAQTGYNTACYGEHGGAKQVAGSGCEYEFQAGSTLDVDGTADFSGATVTGITTSTLDTQTTGALTVTGSSILSGGVQYGADNLYPLGYASADQQIVCGTTTFTAASEIEATGLSTVTYVIASQTTDPASTGALLTVSDPTTTTFILYSWEGDYTAGTTPVEAHWCAIGDQ